jgi:hypothetical protein
MKLAAVIIDHGDPEVQLHVGLHKVRPSWAAFAVIAE